MFLLYIFLLVILIAIIIVSIIPRKSKSLMNKHVVITGGSSGIGKELAKLAIRKGAHVTIIARDVDKLNEARNEIKNCALDDDQIVTRISVDVSDFDSVKCKLVEVEELVGPIYMLINCAGLAICGRFEDLSVEEIQKLVNINFLGTLYPIKVLLPRFKERKEGIIVLTGSQVSLMGMYGYSVYSSCKFALRGLAESLVMEVKPYNISVTLALPADTDTPGFENENKTKPLETQLISGTGGLSKPEDVAAQILKDTLHSRFSSIYGFESFILTSLCVGMSPLYTLGELALQAVLLGPLRIIGVLYLQSFDSIVKKCYVDRLIKKVN